MDDSLILVLLTSLMFAVILNLFLTLRLMAMARGATRPGALPFSLPIGETAPDFGGRRLLDGRPVSSAELAGQANVLIFLSSACGDCRDKLAELMRLRPAMRKAGILMWVIAMEPDRQTAKFFSGSPLLEHVVTVDRATRQKLNPRSGAPFYIFIDHEKRVLASNFIGDENWLGFVRQMEEIRAETGDAA